MADFDSLFVDNLAEFQPVMMQTHYSNDNDSHPVRDTATLGRAKSSGSLDRIGSSASPTIFHLSPPLPRSSSASAKTPQPRPASFHGHRRQLSAGSRSLTSAPTNDPFSEIMTEFWAEQGVSPHHSPDPSDSAAPPLQPDRLLSFRSHQPSHVLLLNENGHPVNVRTAAHLHGMFFLAESPWDAAGNPNSGPSAATNPVPNELTCYRRNLFQVTGSLTMPLISAVIVGEEGKDLPLDSIATGKRRFVQSVEASISGIESVDFAPVKIITVPWKSAVANASQPGQQSHPSNDDFPPMSNAARPTEKEPLPLLFNYPPAYYTNPVGIPPEEEADGGLKYPLSWKRLQFRSATANNGRRKDLQQHFVVKVTIVATLFPENMNQTSMDKLEKVAICEAYSGAIIVRGRSPRNFSSRNDIPLTGSAMVSSRHNSNAAATNSSSSSASAPKKARHHSSSSIPLYDEDNKPSLQQLQLHEQAYALGQVTSQPYLTAMEASMIPVGLGFSPNTLWGSADNTWMDMGTAVMNMPMQPLQNQAGLGANNADYMPQYSFNANATFSDLSDPSSRMSLTGMGQSDDYGGMHSNTSLYNLDRIPNQENSMPPPSMQRPIIPRASSAQSPSMDLLYEYFPIGIDDWLPPVDVVYRPHAAHHQTQLPTTSSSRSKRLFSETPFE